MTAFWETGILGVRTRLWQQSVLNDEGEGEFVSLSRFNDSRIGK